ncbi:MAG: hypothetical protein K2L86_00310 [Lachnospiraceae bacterium]|nr:hypothetical protein [Lachnospiraceae bacterium]
MTDNRTGSKAAKVCGAFIFTVLLALLLTIQFDFYYDLNDDTMIKDILSGAYTGRPSGFCIQMLYPLGWCIALLYKAIPAVSWYGLFLCLCQFGVFFLIAVRLLSLMRRAWTQLAALIVETALAFGLFLRQFVVIQYSVTAGICMAGAVFLFLTAPGTDKPSVFFRRNLLPLMLVVLSFMIRIEVCFMLMPFLLLAGMAKWCGERRFFTLVNFRKYLMLIVAAVLCMAAAYSLDLLAYSGSEWSSFRNFFDARTKLYDFYGLPKYEEHRSFYESIGLSKESYALLENYNFALDESIDTWRLEAIVAYQEQLAKQGIGLNNTFGFISKKSLKEALWQYKNQLQSNHSLVSMTVIVLYLLYILMRVAPARGKARVNAVLWLVFLLMVRSVLWLYLYMVDRLPDRVTVPLLMMELVALLGFWIGEGNTIMSSTIKIQASASKAAKILVSLLCITGAAVVLLGSLRAVQAEYERRAAADARWNAMMDYCRKNGNNYYVIDVYSATSYQNASYSEKIFTETDNTYKNFDYCGGWAAKSPLARQKLARHHFRDVQSALGSTAYFVTAPGKDLHWLVQYYKKRNISVTPMCVDQIQTASSEPAFDVYQLIRD